MPIIFTTTNIRIKQNAFFPENNFKKAEVYFRFSSCLPKLPVLGSIERTNTSAAESPATQKTDSSFKRGKGENISTA